MKKNKILTLLSILFFAFILSSNLQAQIDRIGFTVSNNTTGLPVLTYHHSFYTNFHPGLDVQLGWKLNKSDKNKFYLNANTGFYYHQFVQTLFKLYPSVSYERAIKSRANFTIGLGGGYGLSFEGDRAFVKNDDGSYDQKGFFGPRSQFLLAFDIGGSYALKKDGTGPLFQAKLTTHMQGVYVKSYVTLLPINGFQIGMLYPLNK